MKKILLTSIAVAACGVSAFGQGQIFFENADQSSGFVTLNSASQANKTGSGLVVELFWNNGTSYVLEDTYTSTYSGSGSGGQGPGQFNAGELTIPAAGTQSFYVEGFYTTGGKLYSGTTADFVATVNPPGTPALTTDSGGGPGGTWTGNLTLTTITPEPSTIALGGLGAAALLLFRRRK